MRRRHGGRGSSTRLLRMFGCAWLVISLWNATATNVQAARIHNYRVVTSNTAASLGYRWQAFLAKGPNYWAHHQAPRFPSGLALQTANGQLVRTPFVTYLDWRRDLNSARFDFFHPNIGPQLASLPAPQIQVTTLRPTTPTRTPVFNPTDPQPQTIVPEPGSLGIALCLIATGLMYRQIGRLQSPIASM